MLNIFPERPVVRNAVVLAAEVEVDADLFSEPGVRLVLDLGETNQQLPFRGATRYYLRRLLELAGASKWSEMVGRPLRVRGTGREIAGVGHVVRNDWLELADLDGKNEVERLRAVQEALRPCTCMCPHVGRAKIALDGWEER